MGYKSSCYDCKNNGAKTEIACYLNIALLDLKVFEEVSFFYGGTNLLVRFVCLDYKFLLTDDQDTNYISC